MPEQLLKTGAKKITDGTASPISCDATGALIEQRKFATVVTKVLELAISDTATHKTTALDLSGAGLVSIRLDNKTGKALSIYFYGDEDDHPNSGLRDLSGALYTINIPQGAYYYIITPNDMPFLNYLRKIRMGVTAAEVPTNTNPTSIYVVTKT